MPMTPPALPYIPATAPFTARLCVQMGFTCLRKLTRTLRIPVDEDPRPDAPVQLSWQEFLQGWERITAAGFPVERAAEQAAEANRGGAREAAERHLLAGVGRRVGDELGHVLRAGDGAGHDALAEHLLLLEVVPGREVGTGGAGRDVLRGDVDTHVLLRVLDALLVVRDVEADEQDRQDGEPDRGDDAAGAVCHRERSFLRFS